MGVIEFARTTAHAADRATESDSVVQRRRAPATGHHAHAVGMAMVMRYLMRNQERFKAERTYGIAMATANAALARQP